MSNGSIPHRWSILMLPGVSQELTRHKVCQHMNNFSSASAIVTALTSPTVTNLIRTCKSKAKPILHMLDRDLTPTNGAYFETLRQAETKELIPWLGITGFPCAVFPHTDLTP